MGNYLAADGLARYQIHEAEKVEQPNYSSSGSLEKKSKGTINYMMSWRRLGHER